MMFTPNHEHGTIYLVITALYWKEIFGLQVIREGCTLGDWINKKGWTLAEYARRAGRSRRMISYFCNNERPMLPEDIHIANILLGVKFEQLYVWKDDPTNLE